MIPLENLVEEGEEELRIVILPARNPELFKKSFLALSYYTLCVRDYRIHRR